MSMACEIELEDPSCEVYDADAGIESSEEKMAQESTLIHGKMTPFERFAADTLLLSYPEKYNWTELLAAAEDERDLGIYPWIQEYAEDRSGLVAALVSLKCRLQNKFMAKAGTGRLINTAGQFSEF